MEAGPENRDRLRAGAVHGTACPVLEHQGAAQAAAILSASKPLADAGQAALEARRVVDPTEYWPKS